MYTLVTLSEDPDCWDKVTVDSCSGAGSLLSLGLGGVCRLSARSKDVRGRREEVEEVLGSRLGLELVPMAAWKACPMTEEGEGAGPPSENEDARGSHDASAGADVAHHQLTPLARTPPPQRMTPVCEPVT